MLSITEVIRLVTLPSQSTDITSSKLLLFPLTTAFCL